MEDGTMRKTIFSGSLAVVASTLLSVGCSEQSVKEEAQSAAKVVAEVVEELGEAAREGSAAQAGRDLEAAGRAAADAVEAKGLEQAAQDEAASVVDTARANVEDSTRTEREAYDAARESGGTVIEAAGDAENAVLAIPNEEDAKKKVMP
jgi:hypothetical protein